MPTVLTDRSPNWLDLTMVGTVPSVLAPASGTPNWRGGYGPFSTSNYVSRIPDNAFQFTGDFAYVIAFYYDGSSVSNEVLLASEGTSTTHYATLYITSASKLAFYQDGPGGPTGTTTIAAGWHTVTVRKVGTAFVAKLDGVSELSATLSATTATGDSTFYIGRDQSGSSFTSGSIHLVRAWDEVNTPSQATLDSIADGTLSGDGNEIAAYTFDDLSNRLADSSGNGRNLTMTGTVPFVDDVRSYSRFGGMMGPFSASNYLERVSDLLQLSGDMAITAAFYYGGSNGGFQVLCGIYGSQFFEFYIPPDSFLTYNATAGSDPACTNALTVGWHTMTARISSGTLVVKIDGVQQINAAVTPPTITGTTTLRIGIAGNGTSPATTVKVAEMRFWGAASLPSQATLDTVVSLTDLTYAGVREGNEVAFYSFEETLQNIVNRSQRQAVDKQVFTASGVWHKPSGAKVVKVVCFGAGGGGGGAMGGPTSTHRNAGTGGGGGAQNEAVYLSAALGDIETVTVGAGGGGGAGGSSAAGSNGVVGGNSSFGAHLTAYGGGGGKGNSNSANNMAGGGGGGRGSAGTTTSGYEVDAAGGVPTYTADAVGNVAGGAGGNGDLSTGGCAEYGGAGGQGNFQDGFNGSAGSSLFGGGGGGSGGPMPAGNSERPAGAGGRSGIYSGGGGGTAGATNGGTGGAGTSRSGTGRAGDGGGGGGAQDSGTGGTGGAGGVPSGGGGGGGGGTSVGGTGGAGGRGEVIVWTYF